MDEIIAKAKKNLDSDDPFARFKYRSLLLRYGRNDETGLEIGDLVEVQKSAACVGPIKSMIWKGIIVKIHPTAAAGVTISPLTPAEEYSMPGQASAYRSSGVYVPFNDSLFPSKVILLEPVHPDSKFYFNWRVWHAVYRRQFWHRIERSWNEMVPNENRNGAIHITMAGPGARTYRDIYGPWCPWRRGHFG